MMKGLTRDWGLICALSAAVLAAPHSSAFAAPAAGKLVLCMNKTTGSMAARKRCRPNETVLNASSMAEYFGQLAVAGAAGPKGDTGPAGQDGKEGARGARGPQGLIGPTGPQGPDGPVGAQGPQGADGAPGPQGAAGPAGPQGLAAWDAIPGGVTVTGRARCYESFTGDTLELWSQNVSLPGKAPAKIENSAVVVKLDDKFTAACPDAAACLYATLYDNSAAKSDLCTGSFDAPSAPPGLLCLYVGDSFANVNDLMVYTDSTQGFLLSWLLDGAQNNGTTDLDVAWAYTADCPSSAAQCSGGKPASGPVLAPAAAGAAGSGSTAVLKRPKP